MHVKVGFPGSSARAGFRADEFFFVRGRADIVDSRAVRNDLSAKFTTVRKQEEERLAEKEKERLLQENTLVTAARGGAMHASEEAAAAAAAATVDTDPAMPDEATRRNNTRLMVVLTRRGIDLEVNNTNQSRTQKTDTDIRVIARP
jgi:hypothetical protein